MTPSKEEKLKKKLAKIQDDIRIIKKIIKLCHKQKEKKVDNEEKKSLKVMEKLLANFV